MIFIYYVIKIIESKYYFLLKDAMKIKAMKRKATIKRSKITIKISHKNQSDFIYLYLMHIISYRNKGKVGRQ